MVHREQTDELLSLDCEDGVYTLRLGNGESRFSPRFVQSVTSHLETVGADATAKALVTVSSGKFWAFGLDLDWMAEHPASIGDHLQSIHELYARMLELPVISVAAIQGHAFAAGAMLALTHDFRVMRRDRGYFCLPEVDLGIVFTPGMFRLLRARLSTQTCHEAVVAGRRYGGTDAQAAGIVHEAVAEQAVSECARELAMRHGGKPRDALAQNRSGLYSSVIAALRDVQANRTDAAHFSSVLPKVG